MGRGEAPWVLAGSALYLLIAIGVTIAANVPLNDALARIDPTAADAASRWSSYVGDWTLWNHVRAVAAFAAAGLLTVALALEPDPWEAASPLSGEEVNVYLIEDGQGVAVYDAGEKGMATSIALAAGRMGGIKRVVLGHGDTDHRGLAPTLSELAPIECHPDAVEQAQGRGGRDYWDMSKLPLPARKLHEFTHEHVWDGGPVKVSSTVEEGDSVAGFEVVELSGHAPGLIGAAGAGCGGVGPGAPPRERRRA